MRLLLPALLLLTASCATTHNTVSGSCPPKPNCLTAPSCYVDISGCNVCQCSNAYDDWRQKPAGPPPSLNP